MGRSQRWLKYSREAQSVIICKGGIIKHLSKVRVVPADYWCCCRAVVWRLMQRSVRLSSIGGPQHFFHWGLNNNVKVQLLPSIPSCSVLTNSQSQFMFQRVFYVCSNKLLYFLQRAKAYSAPLEVSPMLSSTEYWWVASVATVPLIWSLFQFVSPWCNLC